MTKEDALRAARALLDGMAGTTEENWWDSGRDDGTFFVENGLTYVVGTGMTEEDAAHIARSCPARLGPVLRALMEGD